MARYSNKVTKIWERIIGLFRRQWTGV